MKVRTLWLLATVGCILPIAAIMLFQSHTEPVFRGQKLTSWLREYAERYTVPMDDAPPQNTPAAQAIREVGTNGIPVLLELIDCRPVSLKWEIARRLGGPPTWLEDPKDARRHLAWCGFEALGPAAQPAVPALMKLLKSKDPDKRWAAAVALSYMGPAAEGSVQSLLEGTREQNQKAQLAAIWALGKVEAHPELVVPRLMEIIHSAPAGDPSSAPLLVTTILSLSKFGSNATRAAPLLLPLQSHTDWSIRDAASIALRRIGPELENEAKP